MSANSPLARGLIAEGLAHTEPPLGLEPAAIANRSLHADRDLMVRTSIAISLRRIADSMDRAAERDPAEILRAFR